MPDRSKLRIFALHPELSEFDNEQLEMFRFDHVLEKKPFVTEKGRRTERCFHLSGSQDPAIIVNYRDENNAQGLFYKVVKTFHYMDENGEEAYTFEKTYKEGLAECENQLKLRAEFIFEDLKSRAKEDGVTSYIETLYAFFKDEKDDFIETRSTMFIQEINATLAIDLSTLSASEAAIIGQVQTILNANPSGTGFNIGELLKYQMTWD